MSIYVIDKHPLMRHAIGALVSSLPLNFKVECVEFFDEFLIKLENNKAPILVSMEIEANIIENIIQLKKNSNVLIFVISEQPAKDAAHVILSAGADCYIEKITPTEIIKKKFMEFLSPSSPLIIKSKTRLTKRQTQLLILIDMAFSNLEIANYLNLKPSTVKVHLHRLYTSFGVKNRLQAVRYAKDRGLL